jgi:lipopolysaccharide transport system ATP-binding protein
VIGGPSDIVIRAERLGKRYRIGHAGKRADTLRDAVAGLVRPRNGAAADGEDLWALRDVSFEIARGEVVGVIGRNGAGKSTLLKILSRITPPTEGRVRIRGRVGSLLEVGTGFHPELTGRENVYLSGAFLGMRRVEIEAAFDEIVAFAEIERFIDTPVKHYSTGMYLRLAFAVAAHLRPEILLIDEALSVGDVDFQSKCLGKMGQVAEEGRTVLVVSHSMTSIKALCARAMLLEAGTLAAFGPVDAVVDRYLSRTQTDTVQRTIPDDAYGGPTPPLRVVSVRLLGPVGDRFAVYWRQPIELSVEMEARESVADVILGASVLLLDGSRVFTVHHDNDPSFTSWDFEPGRWSIRVTLQNELRPGRYRITLGASRRYYGLGLLFEIEVATLEVLDCGASGATPNPAEPGVVNGASVWEPPVESSPR